MKFRNLIKSIVSPLPPAAQGPIGSKADQEWASGGRGFLETLRAWGSDGRIYEADAADQRRLRPILLPDPRAERNRKIAEQRRAARARGEASPVPVSFAVDAPQQAQGTAPAAYSLDAGFPDMPAEVKAFYSGSVKREWGPRHVDGPMPWKVLSETPVKAETCAGDGGAK